MLWAVWQSSSAVRWEKYRVGRGVCQ